MKKKYKVLFVKHNYALSTTAIYKGFSSDGMQDMFVTSVDIRAANQKGEIKTLLFKEEPYVNIGDEIIVQPDEKHDKYYKLIENLTQSETIMQFITARSETY